MVLFHAQWKNKLSNSSSNFNRKQGNRRRSKFSINDAKNKTRNYFQPSNNRTFKDDGKIRIIRQATFDTEGVCIHMSVHKLSQKVFSTCKIGPRMTACIAQVDLPYDWWTSIQEEKVDVYFSANENTRCEGGDIRLVASITLRTETQKFEQLKEDPNIIVMVPQTVFYPGSKFRIPIKLQANSQLSIFNMKVKAKYGINVIGAEEYNTSRWRIVKDIFGSHGNQHSGSHSSQYVPFSSLSGIFQNQHSAVVTARAFYPINDSIRKEDGNEEGYSWLFEVDENWSGDEGTKGRMNFVVEYEMNAHQKEHYRSVENKIMAKVDIQRDNIYELVPVIKTKELINMAVITGRELHYPMIVFSVTHSGRVSEVTSQTTCHSENEKILKVSRSCSSVYFDGSETAASPSVAVIIKLGKNTKYLNFHTWMPHLPLEVILSDVSLGQIKGWRVVKQPVFVRPSRQKSESEIRVERATAEFGILDNPSSLLLGEDEGELLPLWKEDEHHINMGTTVNCDLRFQSAIIKVGASFYTADQSASVGDKKFLIGRDFVFDITDDIIGRIKVSDSSIAKIDGTIVEGMQPGRTMIQVTSYNGVVMGESELEVTSDKVSISNLKVSIIGSLSVTINKDASENRILIAKISRSQVLTSRYQEALLDIAVEFDDDTSIPLFFLPQKDYLIDADTLNNHIINIGNPLPPNSIPRLVALGQGSGDLLRVHLEIPEICQKKKPRPLAMGHAYIEVDLGRQAESTLQSDASLDRRAVDYMNLSEKKYEKGIGHVRLNYNSADIVPEESNLREVQLRQLDSTRDMTPLEIGMYLLLAIFCVAVLIFALNCILFLRRRSRLGGSRKFPLPIGILSGRSTEKNNGGAPDWVWIGADVLEANALACSRTLMPEETFRGVGGSASTLAKVNGRPNGACATALPTTYRGSECSVRIRGTVCDGPEQNNKMLAPRRASEDSMLDDGSSTMDSAGPGISSRNSPLQKPCGRGLARLEEGYSLGSDVEWHYSKIGIDQEELTDYFDNLKETSA